MSTGAPVSRSDAVGSRDLGSGPAVAPGASERRSELCVWGIDGSTKRLAVGFASEGRVETRHVDFTPNLWHGARLEDIWTVTRTFVSAWAVQYPPVYVFVEQPSGKSVSPQLSYAIGTIMAATYSALRFVFDFPVEVRTVPSSTWKREATGRGWSPKPATLRWARNEHGFAGDCACLEGVSDKCKRDNPAHDCADAIGIAVAGRRLTAPSPVQLALA
jgi:hypothetical protein